MKKITLTITAIMIACVSAFSQSVTETRHIKTTALQLYENYKVIMSGLYSKSAYTEDNFIGLFDSNAEIYNDILPDNLPQQLSPSEYFEKFQTSIKRIYPVFSDFDLGDPVAVGNKWLIKCSFTRGTRFLTQKDMKYPEWSFNYTMTIEMEKLYNIINKVYQHARIVSIVVDDPIKGFFIIENENNMILETKSGETLNNWDDDYQSRIFPENEWKINDIQVPEALINDNIFRFSKGKFSKNRTDPHFYQIDIQRSKKNIFGIGLNFSPIPTTFGNKISDENAEIFKEIGHKSNVLSFSFFYGKQITYKEKSTVFLNFGLDFNKYSHEYNGRNDTTYLTHDTDGDDYYRKIRIDALNEKINLVSIFVPLSVEYLYQLTQRTKKQVFFSFELGLFADCSLSAKSRYNLNTAYSGIYPKYFGVEFDHYYDYGTFDINGNQKLNARFNLGMFGGVGLWFALNESNLLKFNVSYKHNFNSPLEYKEKYVISKSNPKTDSYSNDYEPYQSLLHSTKQGMQNISLGVSWIKTVGGRNK